MLYSILTYWGYYDPSIGNDNNHKMFQKTFAFGPSFLLSNGTKKKWGNCATMAKEQRSTKWTFLFYEESAPEDYFEYLRGTSHPFILSPWHDKDINRQTRRVQKITQTWCILSGFIKVIPKYQISSTDDKLNGPAHVEVVMSPTGLFDYFITMQKALTISKILWKLVWFDSDKFFTEGNPQILFMRVVDIIEENDFTEFEGTGLRTCEQNNINLLGLIIERTLFLLLQVFRFTMA